MALLLVDARSLAIALAWTRLDLLALACARSQDRRHCLQQKKFRVFLFFNPALPLISPTSPTTHTPTPHHPATTHRNKEVMALGAKKKIAPARNRTGGQCMASIDFTTKPEVHQ